MFNVTAIECQSIQPGSVIRASIIITYVVADAAAALPSCIGKRRQWRQFGLMLDLRLNRPMPPTESIMGDSPLATGIE
jgi:hypothetical protein